MSSTARAVTGTLVMALSRRALAVGSWTQRNVADAWAGYLPVEEAAALAHRLLELLPGRPIPDDGEPDARLAVARILRDLPALPAPSPVSTRPPRPGRWRVDVPELADRRSLAALLDLTPAELDWFADRGHWLRRAEQPLRHYTFHTTDPGRLIEAPKPRMRELQRRLLRRILRRVPTHDVAHGFVAGRSAHTAASVHAGRPVLVRADLRHFFASITAARVRAVFRALGYPSEVAATLTGLVTTRTPEAVLRGLSPQLRPWWRGDHLPQGAPTSPALANLVAHRLDARVAGLAAAHGCVLTRYADDLAFSGPATLDVGALVFALTRLVADEGFALHPAKTSVTRTHQRQRMLGLVVNERAGVSRRERDELRALLHNCVRTGPQAQNRDGHPDFRAHLLGRIGWAATGSEERLARYTEMFERISW